MPILDRLGYLELQCLEWPQWLNSVLRLHRRRHTSTTPPPFCPSTGLPLARSAKRPRFPRNRARDRSPGFLSTRFPGIVAARGSAPPPPRATDTALILGIGRLDIKDNRNARRPFPVIQIPPSVLVEKHGRLCSRRFVAVNFAAVLYNESRDIT